MTAMTAPYDVEAIRADFPILSELVRGKRLVYLDSAGSAQKPRQVIAQPLLDEGRRDPQALAGPNDLVGDEALAIVLTEGADRLLVEGAAGDECQSRTGQQRFDDRYRLASMAVIGRRFQCAKLGLAQENRFHHAAAVELETRMEVRIFLVGSRVFHAQRLAAFRRTKSERVQ